MKNIINKRILIVTSLMLSLLSSCNFLDTELSDRFDREDFFDNEVHTYSFLAGVYGSLRPAYMTNMSIWINAGTDEMLYNQNVSDRAGSEISRFAYSSFDKEVTLVWQKSYASINQANDLIYNLEARDTISGLDMINKRSMLGEGLTIRALNYLNLVRMFENIPLRLLPMNDVAHTQEDLLLPPSTPTKVYDQIIEDLEQAIPMLPEKAIEYGRISKSAAQGILVRAYMHLAGNRLKGGSLGIEECYRRAIANSDEIINDGKHSLLPDYKQVFLNQIYTIPDDNEVLWEIDFKVTSDRDDGSQVGFYSGPRTSGPDANSPNTNAWLYSSVELEDVYLKNPNDTIRSRWNISPFRIQYKEKYKDYIATEVTNHIQFYPGKWKRMDRTLVPNGRSIVTALEPGYISKYRTSFNFPIIRYSDVLLMKAEAMNAIYGPSGEVFGLINQVRSRAGVRDIEEELQDTGNGISKDAVLKALQDERMRELCFEGLRRFDLVRWGILEQNVHALSEKMKLTDSWRDEFLYMTIPLDEAEHKHQIFPIPDDELVVNANMTQNPEW